MIFQKCSAPLAAALVIVCGCQAVGDLPTPEDDIARATGATQPIVFRTEPQPIDEAEADPELLSLSEVLRRSLQNDPRIQAALSRVRIAQAEADQSRLLPNPVVSVALRYPESGGSPVIEAGLTQDFISLLQRPGLISAADDRLRAAGAEAVAAALDVLSEVKGKYVTVQALDELVLASGRRQGLIGRLLELARARLQAGEGTQLDVVTADAQRVEIESEVGELQLERRQARLALSRLIGEPSGEATWKLPAWRPPAAVSTPVSDWIRVALARHPEIQARRWQLSALGAERRLAPLSALEGASAGVDAEREEEWSVGPAVAAPLPIFDFGQSRRERARAAVLEAVHELTRTKREVIEEVRAAHEAFASTLANFRKIREALLPLAERRLEQAQLQYKAGEADVTNLFLAEQDLQTARAKMIDLQRKSSVALVRLERAAGGPAVAARLMTTPATDARTHESSTQTGTDERRGAQTKEPPK